jgi:UDP-glucose 4-epimerase
MNLTNWKQLHGGFFKGVRVLVTGGAGFIGSNLCVALNELGASVTALDDLSGGGLPPGESISPAKLVIGSILDEKLLAECTAGCRHVFHLAALGSVPRSVEQPRKYHDANTTGTLNVLEAARAAGVKRVMFSASSSCYGDSPVLPKVESMPVQPKSPYAANKVAGEALMAAYAGCYPPLDTATLRYFNIFGPRQNANSAYAAVIAAFAKALLKGERPTIFGDGEQSRDFTYVDNAVHANLLAARSEIVLAGTPINIAVGQRVTVTELAHQMAAALGRADLKPVYAPERAGDVKHSLASLMKATELLDYRPIVDFAPGLVKTMEWYKNAIR